MKVQEALKVAIEALEASTCETIQHDDYFKLVDEAHKACKEALAELQAHDDDVIERCASDLDRQGFNHAADAIRELKESLSDRTIDALRKAISKLPAQSLVEHDNELIERCAKVCENNAGLL